MWREGGGDSKGTRGGDGAGEQWLQMRGHRLSHKQRDASCTPLIENTPLLGIHGPYVLL